MAARSQIINGIVFRVNDDPQFIQRLKSLDTACAEIEQYYHEYDYQDVPCNGFRTFVKIVDSFFDQLASFLRQADMDKNKLKDFEILSHILSRNAEVAVLIRKKGLDYPLQVTDADFDIVKSFAWIDSKHVEPLFGSIGPFYVKTGFQAAYRNILTVVGFLFTTSLWDKMRYLLMPGYRIQTLAHLMINFTLDNAIALRTTYQFPLSVLVNWFSQPVGCTSGWVTVSRTLSEWRIRLPDAKTAAIIEKKIPGETDEPLIKCMIFTPPPDVVHDCKSIVLHMPGGGFLLCATSADTELMSRVCRDLGVTIVVPQYRTAPEDPYPAALQDALDVYMFLMSRDQNVIDALGFHPEEIVLSGISAGGQLVTALTIVLNEIRRRGGEVTMPRGLSLQCPAEIVGFIAYPGALLSGLDMCASIGQLRASCLVYARSDPPIDFNDTDLTDLERWREVAMRFNDRLKDPLYNPIAYDKYDDLKDIPVCILASEMDSIMDHSIFLANKWKGQVTFDVGRGLPHGFPASASVPAVREEVDRLIQRLAFILGTGGEQTHL